MLDIQEMTCTRRKGLSHGPLACLQHDFFGACPILQMQKKAVCHVLPAQQQLTVYAHLRVSFKVLGSRFSSLYAGMTIVRDFVGSPKMVETGICM